MISIYTLLVQDDNTLFASKKTAVMQYSKLVDSLLFLCPLKYNDENMMDYNTVLLEYLTPVSRTYNTVFLTRLPELYNGHIQYVLPVDTAITAEAGDVELQLTFIRTEADSESGTINEHTRKIGSYRLKVFPIANWSQFIPDKALTVLDQKIARLLALQEEITEMQEAIINGTIDDDAVAGNKTWSSDKINNKLEYLDERLDNLDGTAEEHSDDL